MVYTMRKRTTVSKRSAADRFSRLSRFAVNDDDSNSDYGLARGGAIIMKRGFRSTKQGRSRSDVGHGQHLSGDSGEDRGYEEESDLDDETSDICSSSDGGDSRGCGTWKRSNSKRRWSTGGVKKRRMGRRSCCVSGGEITDDLAAGDSGTGPQRCGGTHVNHQRQILVPHKLRDELATSRFMYKLSRILSQFNKK